jgi:adenosylhomocysteine nucleosidase/5'-methylthioadenosine nucleosidase
MAMADEALPIISQFELELAPNELSQVLPFKLYRGTVGDLRVSLIVSGQDSRYAVDNIGTQAATLMAHSILHLDDFDLVITAGTAGGFAKRGADIGTVYLSNEKFVFHDRRVPLDGFDQSAVGHYPAMAVSVMASELALPTGIISTGSSLQKSADDIDVIERFSAVAKEMEAAAVAWVCWLHQTPIMAIKSITNLLDQPGEAEQQFAANLQFASQRLAVEVDRVVSYLQGKAIDDLG